MSSQKNLQLWPGHHSKLDLYPFKLRRHRLPSRLCLLAWDHPHGLRHRIRTLQNNRALLLHPRRLPRVHLQRQIGHKLGLPCLQFRDNLLRSLIGCHATTQLLPCHPKLGARIHRAHECLVLMNSIRLVICRLLGRQWLLSPDI